MRLRVIASTPDRRLLDQHRQTRAMRWIMAIMLFLTVLAAALGLSLAAATRLLDRQLGSRLTVQIIEANPGMRDLASARVLARLRATPGVLRATPVDRAALAALLRPWLGEEGAEPDLPIPAMIDADLASGDAATLQAVRNAVLRAVPSAHIDRHEKWLAPVSAFMQIMAGFALGLVLMMAAVTATVVVLTARAGLDTHRPTIDVMHMLGSTDVQIARLFQRRIALDTLFGGLIGTGCGIAAILFIGAQAATLGSDLLSGAALSLWDWVALLLLPVLFAALAMAVARYAVLAALRRIL